jgi:hypothetical protein
MLTLYNSAVTYKSTALSKWEVDFVISSTKPVGISYVALLEVVNDFTIDPDVAYRKSSTTYLLLQSPSS